LDTHIQTTLRIVKEQAHESRTSLATVSKFLGLSETRFRRLFKLRVGKTFVQYLREARMTRAAQLLDQQNLPIKEISHLCGYHDVSNFYRDFRKVHETTPQLLRLRRVALLNETKKPPSSALKPCVANQQCKLSE
jgi:AraC family transcriptional regulator, regulatory protein of adaptative response / methylphosphotriester-DNA alkyltransferase methyltransferase